MDDDVQHDLEAATRALEAELRSRDPARAMTQAEHDELVDCGAGLERALRRAQEAEMPITEEAFAVWDRARLFVREHEVTRSDAP
jgi:hypothetical protein